MDKYAVIGHPVKHSLSPKIHSEFAKQCGHDIEYTILESPLDGFSDTVKNFIASGGRGCNVTLPFKIEAFELADTHSDLAKEAGAANTLQFLEDGTVYADSTDGTGITQDITNNMHYPLRAKKILILGAGGAARLIVGPILAHAPSQVFVANRTEQKAIDIANDFASKGMIIGVGFDALEGHAPYDLIINATSAGYTGNEINLPASLIGEHTWCYDLMYGKQGAPFLEWAKQFNPQCCIDGLGMLVEQAAASFYVWRGVYPETKPVIELLRSGS